MRKNFGRLSCVAATLAVVLVVPIGIVNAQQVSNDELFAGYCVGVLQQQIEQDNEAIVRIDTDPDFLKHCPTTVSAQDCKSKVRSAYLSMIQQTNADLGRYQAYVLATDANRSPDARDSVLLAASRGRLDQRDCVALNKGDCTALVEGANFDKAFACTKERYPVCARTFRCDEPSTLPF
jgi:hypothetical protein